MSIVTMTTDFGVGSSFVAEMKGIVLGINSRATIVDITHGIEPQSVFQAAFVIAQSVSSFPNGSIHLIVVDPGVGTDRNILLAEIGDWKFVCPDNGILTLLAEKFPIHSVRVLDQPNYWRSPISSTFHGRDIMAPVVGHLSRATVLASELGHEIDEFIRLEFPAPKLLDGELLGEIISIDSFGNLVTNISRDELAEVQFDSLQVRLGFHRIRGLVRTFGDRGARQLVAYVGSGGYLEIAAVNENAQEKLAARLGDGVVVSSS